jgi:phage terminase small subunit
MARRTKAEPMGKAEKKTEKLPKKAAEKAKKAGVPEKGEILDFASLGIGDGLNEREKRFVYYYTFPGDKATFMNQTRAAEKAGYKGRWLFNTAYQLRRKPNVDAAIKSVLSSKVAVDLEEKYQKALETLDQRAFFNPADYVKQKTMTIKTGKDKYAEIEYEGFKDLTELTPQQLEAVDGIDYRGVNGTTRIFVMADKGKTLMDIINMRNKINGAQNDDDFDVEATAEIIKAPQEQLAVKLTMRKKKEELSHDAGYMKSPKEQSVEEL